jgi:hypothetical protein
MVVQRVGDELHLAALSSVSEAGDARVRQAFPILIEQPSTAQPIVTPILSRQPFVISDAQAEVDEVTREIARARGYRSQLVVPMLREQSAVGVISLTRREAGGFTQDEVALLQTFADQAVIAIENVRLFTELEARNRDLTEALEQQTATSEILSVISDSPTDLRPVFDAVVRNAGRLCEAANASLHLAEGDVMRKVAEFGYVSTRLKIGETRPITQTTVSGRAMLEGRPIDIADLREAVMVQEPSLPSRTCASSRSWRHAITTSRRRWSSRPRRLRSCASSAARRPTSSRSSTRSSEAP